MSTLTKIFVVLMVILSITFTTMTISFVAKTTGWKTLAEDYQQELKVVETHMRSLSAAHAAEKTAWLDSRNIKSARIAELESVKASQLAEIAELQDSVAGLKAEKGDSEGLARRLSNQLQVAQTGWKEAGDELDKIEKRSMQLERRNLDLNERVNEQTAQIVVLVQKQHLLEQQINILRDESSKVARGGGSSRATPEAISSTSMVGVRPATKSSSVTPIRGRILEVQGSLATISVGSADGVREGMVFVIYRGRDYIADLEVSDVEPGLAAGRIMRAKTMPRSSDMVMDEPALGYAN
ncbi:MAG: hypothetical protein DHS20C16_19990 [Phycisphaerae bacterium]|nr:MAG: hypothetical protein DHS20C16_19990 [Phycisphaerae bacterium]